MKLYEIDGAVEAIINECVDPETGELREDVDAALDALEYEREKIALHLAAVVVGERCEADAVDQQAKRLAERARLHRNRADRLAGYIEGNLHAGEKIRDERVQISWRKSEAVVIVDQDKIPLHYMQIKTTPKKIDIKNAIKLGGSVPGAELEKRNRMQIR